MEFVSKLLSTILAISLLASPGAAFSSGTSTPSSGSGVGTGIAIGVGVVGASIIGASLIQQSLVHSFGGKVTAALPCLSPLGPSIWVTIAPAGVMPTSYIWTPATITKLNGPPTHPGQQILGLADVPYVCWNVISSGLFGLFSAFSYLYGLRMTEVGTSL